MNNLSNISFDPPYAAICGITKEEVVSNFMPEIEAMGVHNGWTPEETILQLKAYYDGYHFCKNSPVDIFNPFSLLNALADKELKTTGLLLGQRLYCRSLSVIWKFSWSISIIATLTVILWRLLMFLMEEQNSSFINPVI